MNPLDKVTTVKGYHLMTGIPIRTINYKIKTGELEAKNVHGVWLILIPKQAEARG